MTSLLYLVQTIFLQLQNNTCFTIFFQTIVISFALMVPF